MMKRQLATMSRIQLTMSLIILKIDPIEILGFTLLVKGTTKGYMMSRGN